MIRTQEQPDSQTVEHARDLLSALAMAAGILINMAC
jgi:hypothetical protein